MHHYVIYGLSLATDDPIPGIASTSAVHPVELTVFFDPQRIPDSLAPSQVWQAHPFYINRRAHEEPVQPGLRIFTSPDGAYIRLHYSDNVIFTFDTAGTVIYVSPPPEMSRESVCAYLLNPVLAFCQRLKGLTALHASAIAVQDRAVLFVAPSGSGKSTLAYQFAKHGHTVLTDDVSVLRPISTGELAVLPGYPHLRLWPWTVEELMGSAEALPLIAPDWNKRYVDLQDDAYQFAVQPLPLIAVFVIEGFAAETSIVQIPQARALMSLMANTYLNYLLDAAMRAADFKWLSLLTATVPVYSIVRPHAMDQLDESIHAVLSHLPLTTGG